MHSTRSGVKGATNPGFSEHGQYANEKREDNVTTTASGEIVVAVSGRWGRMPPARTPLTPIEPVPLDGTIEKIGQHSQLREMTNTGEVRKTGRFG